MGICTTVEKPRKSNSSKDKPVKGEDNQIKVKKKKDKKKPNIKDSKKSDVSKTNEKDKVLNKKSEEETKILLETLYKSYYSAKTYFNNNELKDQEFDAVQCIKKIIAAQDMIKEGKCKQINIEDLPKKINSEYITGYSPEERKKKINDIIAQFNKEREDSQKIFNNKVNEMKKKFNKMNQAEKDSLKKILDQDKKDIDYISKEILIIKKTLENDYIPVPLCMTTNKAYKREKINPDIEENTMQIKVNGISYSKSNPIVILAINGDNIKVHKEIKGTNQDDFYCEFSWKFTAEQYRNLVKNKIDIVLGRTYTIKSTKVKGKGELPLRRLKDISSLDEPVKLKMESGKSDTIIDIEIKLRSPLVNKEYEEDFREILKIVKVYPQFKFDE